MLLTESIFFMNQNLQSLMSIVVFFPGDSEYLQGREPEWSNPRIEDGKMPEMPKNKNYAFHKDKVVKFSKT